MGMGESVANTEYIAQARVKTKWEIVCTGFDGGTGEWRDTETSYTPEKDQCLIEEEIDQLDGQGASVQVCSVHSLGLHPKPGSMGMGNQMIPKRQASVSWHSAGC